MITRAQMQRQLRNGGGVMTVKTIRKKYGIGSDLKDFVRKIIPNEIADVAVKAAPFVAPFNPLAAGIMRGVGRYDKRGSLKDALKQGVLTYAGGQGARMLGGAGIQTGFEFLEGIPGTVGGALRMNAGAFGSEIWKYVVSVKTMNFSGEIQDRFPGDFEISYRSTVHKNSNEFFLTKLCQ